MSTDLTTDFDFFEREGQALIQLLGKHLSDTLSDHTKKAFSQVDPDELLAAWDSDFQETPRILFET